MIDVNYVIQKTPGGRLQICHVDRLLRYEGDIPLVWMKFDRENQPRPQARVDRYIKQNSLIPKPTGVPNCSTVRTSYNFRVYSIRSIKINARQFSPVVGATVGHSLTNNEGAETRIGYL